MDSEVSLFKTLPCAAILGCQHGKSPLSALSRRLITESKAQNDLMILVTCFRKLGPELVQCGSAGLYKFVFISGLKIWLQTTEDTVTSPSLQFAAGTYVPISRHLREQ